MTTDPRGLLVVISGPSGVGKGTVVARILHELDGTALSVSVTTRAPRPGDREGIDYHFVDDPAFDEMIHGGELLEWAPVHSARYGTPRQWVERRRDEGLDVVLEIDVQGALAVRERVPEALLVFLAPPSMDELARRLTDRGTESDDERDLRLQNARSEMQAAELFDHVVVNDDLDGCVEEVARIIRDARGSRAGTGAPST